MVQFHSPAPFLSITYRDSPNSDWAPIGQLIAELSPLDASGSVCYLEKMADYIDNNDEKRSEEAFKRYHRRDKDSWKYDYLDPATSAINEIRDKTFYSEDDTIPDELATNTIALLEGLIAHLRGQLNKTKSEPPEPDDKLLTVEQALEHYPDRDRQWLLRKTRGKKFRHKKGKDIKFDKKGFVAWTRSSSS